MAGLFAGVVLCVVSYVLREASQCHGSMLLLGVSYVYGAAAVGFFGLGVITLR